METNWKYALKRRFGNRFAMTAVLFLAVMLWGSAVVFASLASGPACAGFETEFDGVKTDPCLPSRALQAAATDLHGPVPAPDYAKAVSAQTAAAEQAITKALEADHSLIQLYGLYQNLAGRTVIEDTAEPQYAVVKLPDGALTFTGQGDPDARAQAAELKRLELALEERDCRLLYLQAPSKVDPDADTLPAGVEDTSNACMDRLLVQLEALDIDYMDFRQTLKANGGDWSHWFYATDHHWTQEAAFLCFQELCQKLEAEYTQTLHASYGGKTVPITIPQRYTDPGSYSSATLSGFFLGSQGKRVGSLYGGTDDFLLHTPKFPTLMRYDSAFSDQRYGDAQETVLFPDRVARRNWFDATPYEYYAGGDSPVAQLTNYYNPQGPRILVIRDSYACAMTPYLSLISSQLTTIDPRTFSGDLLSYVDWLRPDVVLVLYSSGPTRGEESYRLLSQHQPSKADILLRQDGET